MASERRVVCVLGMHRSGTSAVTGALATLGVALGDQLLPPAPDNPRGFFEDARLRQVNERLLELVGLSATSIRVPRLTDADHAALAALEDEAVAIVQAAFPPGTLWGFKDPRSSRVAPFWQRVFARTGSADVYVLMVRHPAAVARSLATRQSMPAGTALILWFEHTLMALRATLARTAVAVDYDRLVEAPAAQLSRVAERLGLEAPPAASAADQFDPGLRHAKEDPADPSWAGGAASLLELYGLCLKLAADELELAAPEVAAATEALETRLGQALEFLGLVDGSAEGRIQRLEKYAASQAEGVAFWKEQATRWEDEAKWWRQQAESWERTARSG